MGNSPSQRNLEDIITSDDSENCVDNADAKDSLSPSQSHSDAMSTQRRILSFHSVHGENVRLAKQNRLAKRFESFCKGLAFSARPIEVDEIAVMKLAETATNWSGVLRFGVTNTDPQSLRLNLPKYACPDMTNKEGSWAKALAERFCQQGNIIHFYVRRNGEMYYGVNGVQKGLYLSGINCDLPLWVILDIYGNSTAVEFLDPSEAPLLRHGGRPGDSIVGRLSASGGGNLARPIPPPRTLVSAAAAAAAVPQSSLSAPLPLRLEGDADAERRVATIAPAVQPTLDSNRRPGNAATAAASTLIRFPPMRFNSGIDTGPMEFHDVCGRNIRLSNDKLIACRNENEYANGYVFLRRPLNINEKVIIQILNVLPQYNNSLAFGLTSCDPIRLAAANLPDDADYLMDRPEYWIVNKDVAGNPLELDELSFFINQRGEVHFQRNNFPPRIIVYVDYTQKLWPFFDLFGKTQKIRLVGAADITACRPSIVPMSNWQQQQPQRQLARVLTTPGLFTPLAHSQQQQLRVQLPPHQQIGTAPSQGVPASTCAPVTPNAVGAPSFAFPRPPQFTHPPPVAPAPASPTQQPAASCFPPPTHFANNNNGAPLLMNRCVPPPPPGLRHPASGHYHHPAPGLHPQYRSTLPPSPHFAPPPPRPQSPRRSYPAASVDASQPPPTGRVSPAIEAPGAATATTSASGDATAALAQRLQDAAVVSGTGDNKTCPDEPKEECVVCMREEINCVLYTCGHLCMCFECARTTWTRHGFCPICRQPIKDVIKTFKAA